MLAKKSYTGRPSRQICATVRPIDHRTYTLETPDVYFLHEINFSTNKTITEAWTGEDNVFKPEKMFQRASRRESKGVFLRQIRNKDMRRMGITHGIGRHQIKLYNTMTKWEITRRYQEQH